MSRPNERPDQTRLDRSDQTYKTKPKQKRTPVEITRSATDDQKKKKKKPPAVQARQNEPTKVRQSMGMSERVEEYDKSNDELATSAKNGYRAGFLKASWVEFGCLVRRARCQGQELFT